MSGRIGRRRKLKCGMHAPIMQATAREDHQADMAADFRKRFWISLDLTLPNLILSPMLQKLVGLQQAISFPGDYTCCSAFLPRSSGMVDGRFSKDCSKNSNPIGPG